MAIFPKSLRQAVWIQLIMGALFFLPLSLWAQNTYIVTDAAGDTSPGSLAAAVSQLNHSSLSGAITFNESSLITLAQPLGTVSQALTFQGLSVEIDGQNDAQSQFLFQQAFTQQVSSLTLKNNGGAGEDLDLAVTAASWNMDSDDNLFLFGATAPVTQTSSSGVTGQTGGNVQMAIGSGLTVVGTNSIIQIGAGNGGAASDGLGYQDQGGNGGSVSLGFDNLKFSGSDLIVRSGNGGAVSNLNGIGDQGGAGGSVSFSFNNMYYAGSYLQVIAGSGGGVTDTNGIGDQGGTGGSVILQGNNCTILGAGGGFTAGNGGAVTDFGNGSPLGGAGGSVEFSIDNTLTVSTEGGGSFTLQGGEGGAGVTGGAGGGATLMAGSVTLSSGLVVQGGEGASGVSFSGVGGNAFVSIGSFGQSSEKLQVNGGAGGASSYFAGAGGNAQVQGGTVTLSGDAELLATGGTGGDSSISGAGGTGGSAGVSLSLLSLTGSEADFNVSGGTGGSGSSGAFTGNGGNGGNLAVTLGTLGLNTGSALTLTGGAGGAGGDGNTGVNGGNGGAGGSVSFIGGQVNLASGTTFLISGAAGGSAGTGDLSGSVGMVGQAYATIGMLQGQGSLTMNGSSSLLQVDSGNFSGILGGNEVLQKIGSGALTLSGVNSYSGGTSVGGGTLGISNDNSLGAAGTTLTLDGGTLQADGALVSSRNVVITANNGGFNSGLFTSTFSGVISGAGGLLVSGQGVLNLSGTNSYGGGTTVSGGTLGISDDNNLGQAGTSLTLDGGTLMANANLSSARGISITGNNGDFNTGNYSSSLTGNIVGTGSLQVNGQGSLTIVAGNYSGGTFLQSGILAYGGSLALGSGDIAVNGGTLESAGVPTVLQVGGSYSQGTGGTLKLGLSTSLDDDGLNVSGNVGLAGTLSLFSYGPLTEPYLGYVTEIISSTNGSITGNFQQVEENLGGLRLLPLYFSGEVELENIVPSFLALSFTPNQKAIGADLDMAVYKPSLDVLMSQLGVMSSASLQAAENAISPEGLSALFQTGFVGAASRAALVNQRLSELKDSQQAQFVLPGHSQSQTPLFAGLQPVEEEASMGLSKGEGNWSGFVSGNGGIFNVSGNANAPGYQVTTYGLTGAGADVRLSPDFALGLMAGFGESNITLDGGGTLTAGGGQLGLYGLFASQGFYADGLVEGGINQYTTLRQSYVGDASGQTQGQEWSGAVEFGYGWKVKPMTLGPVASLQYTRVGFNGFSETGSVSPLTYPTQSQDSLVSHLGFQADGHWKLGSAGLDPEITLAWEHEYDDLGGNVEAGFGAGDSFAVAGPSLGQDGILVGAGINLAFSKDFSASLNYQGELVRTDLNSQQFGGGVRLGF